MLKAIKAITAEIGLSEGFSRVFVGESQGDRQGRCGMKPSPAWERKFLAGCPLCLQPQLSKCYFEVWEVDNGLVQLWVYHQALPKKPFPTWRKALRRYATSIGIRSLKFVRASEVLARLKGSGRWESSTKKADLSRVAQLGGGR